jgi:hypothetical protein
MKLSDFSAANTTIEIDAISQDLELTRDIQSRLAAFGFLDPPVDGKFGPVSKLALREFGNRAGIPTEDFFGKALADAVLTKSVDEVAPLVLGKDLASNLIKYMMSKNYWVARVPGFINIVYVEGMDENGQLNSDPPDKFNDCRLLISIEEGRPKLLGRWQGTTEPGRFYTMKPPSGVAHLGVARIAFGQYKAWGRGIHHGLSGHSGHEALVQVDRIKIHRDLNKDFKRTGDQVYEGVFAINQHSGFDHSTQSIGGASAGCLVGRAHSGHLAFMALVKSDRRFQESSHYTFMTTVIAGDDFGAQTGWQ